MRVVTHPLVLGAPSTLAQAAAFIEGIAASQSCEILRPGAVFHDRLLFLCRESLEAHYGRAFLAASAIGAASPSSIE